jgi:hypothetical protein
MRFGLKSGLLERNLAFARLDTPGGFKMSLLLIIIVLLLIFGGGGGYYAHRSYGGRGLGGVLGLVLIIVLVLFLFGGLHA